MLSYPFFLPTYLHLGAGLLLIAPALVWLYSRDCPQRLFRLLLHPFPPSLPRPSSFVSTKLSHLSSSSKAGHGSNRGRLAHLAALSSLDHGRLPQHQETDSRQVSQAKILPQHLPPQQDRDRHRRRCPSPSTLTDGSGRRPGSCPTLLMAPQKFSSVRRSRPAARLTPFRDDTGLIALRYESTVQAEPPIPLPPPRNPLRTTTRQSLRIAASLAPVTIVPRPVAPPREQHPLFRVPPSPDPSLDECKSWRDSGLARSSSSATLRNDYEDDVVYQKILDAIADSPTLPDHDLSTAVPSPVSVSSIGLDDAAPAPLKFSVAGSRKSVPPISAGASPTSTTPSPSPTPTRASSLSQRLGLGKAFSIRSAGKKRLQRKSASVESLNVKMSTDRVASEDGTTGSGDKDDSRSRSPESPKAPPPSARSPHAKEHDAGAGQSQSRTPDMDFTPITTSIPEDDLWDDFNNLSFSKRGSLMFGGKTDPLSLFMKPKAPASAEAEAEAAVGDATAPLPVLATDPNPEPTAAAPPATGDNVTDSTAPPAPAAAPTPPSPPPPPTDATSLDPPPARKLKDSPSLPSIRVVSMDVEKESQKVRSLYESGEGLDWQDGGRLSFCERLEPTEEVPSDGEDNVDAAENVVYGFPLIAPRLCHRLLDADRSPSSAPRPLETRSGSPTTSDPATLPTPATTTPPAANSSSLRHDKRTLRAGVARAGGLEDWDDVDVADVDRYGFISYRVPASPETLPPPSRRRNVLTKRPGSAYASSPLALRPPSRKISARSLNTFTSELSTMSRRSTRSSIRSATNRLPHNRDRRWMDEAGDMLELQAGLEMAEASKPAKTLGEMKRKEAERTEKWRKMAKVLNKDQPDGHGMIFEFDTQNPKLIDRTWKGIPDCWRAAAWQSFLSTSAKTWKDPETDEHLMAEFRRWQEVSSPDDVQIDLDVPRTINGHIMFRKRYSGGQRLLFRVLHAISLHFPATGYVQGMASLAATLLCYFDEERCFVMMVRLWKYRGLERLYEPGFHGLMAALREFEKKWLAGKDVATKLVSVAFFCRCCT